MRGIKRDTVTLIQCQTYRPSEVKNAICASLEPLGGIGSFVRPGQRVALKPNLLKAVDPEDAVITHPSIVGAVAEMIAQAGAHAFIIDSPGAGIPYTPVSLKRIYQRCGYMNIPAPVELNFDCRYTQVPYPEGRILKRFEILTPILEADLIINLPKVKTHSFTYITCGVKNLFGVVPGLYKPSYHGRFQEQEHFALMLIDLCQLLGPCLTICDGIVGMEGDGPSWGRKKSLGLVAASPNPFLVDMLISHLIGFDPMKIPGMRQAVDEGLCPENIHNNNIDLVTDRSIEELRVQFEAPSSFISKRLNERLKQIILLRILCHICKGILSAKPLVNRRLCQGCGICAKGCPKGAIRMTGHKAKIKYSRCIHCYCCYELCPHKSIHLKKTLFNLMLHKLGWFKSRIPI